MTQEQYSAVCPYLGLADDADSHATYATEAHRCYRLPNPTRIASPHQESYCLGANHVTCPVYQGEGVPQTQQPRPASTPTGAVAAGAAGAAAVGAAAAAGGSAATPPAEVPTVKGPPPGQASRPPTTPAAKKPSGSAGQLGPRPRSGGISMPVATIGLFGLAIVIIALAFGIQQLVGGDDDDETSSEDSAVETAEALNKTSTAQAGDQPTQPPAQTQQPNGTRTPGASVTPGTGTPSSGGGTYTVRPGDTCGSIAADHDITLDELLEANDMTEDDCTTLQIGQVLEIPS